MLSFFSVCIGEIFWMQKLTVLFPVFIGHFLPNFAPFLCYFTFLDHVSPKMRILLIQVGFILRFLLQ